MAEGGPVEGLGQETGLGGGVGHHCARPFVPVRFEDSEEHDPGAKALEPEVEVPPNQEGYPQTHVQTSRIH